MRGGDARGGGARGRSPGRRGRRDDQRGARRGIAQTTPGGTSDAASWWLVAIMIVTCVGACSGQGFTLSPARAILPAAGLLILAGAMIAGRMRGNARLATGAAAFLQMTLFTISGVVIAYALAARAGPLRDAELAAIDRALGFDWPAVFRAADAAPAAVWIGGIAYHSLTVQMIVCIVALSAQRRVDRLRLAVAAAILSGFVTVLISGIVPAMGNVFDPADYHVLWPSIAWMERDLIAGLRDGSGRVLDLGQLMGIVSFPSYHATLPVILAWAQRDVPKLRVIAPVWGGVTIVATPLFGGHYGIDVLGGLALAVPAIAIAPLLAARRAPAQSHRSPARRTLLREGDGARAQTAESRRPAGEGTEVTHGLV